MEDWTNELLFLVFVYGSAAASIVVIVLFAARAILSEVFDFIDWFKRRRGGTA